MKSDAGHELVRLPSGGFTIRSLAYGELLHPGLGPVAEAETLYVEQLALRERLLQTKGEFVVWDVGLGAAANALTVLRAVRECATPLRLVSFDKNTEQLEFALDHKEALGYFDGYEGELTELMRKRRVAFRNGEQTMEWELVLGDFPSWCERMAAGILPAVEPGFQPGGRESGNATRAELSVADPGGRMPPSPSGRMPDATEPHAILFDPHSPAKNPEMWTLPMFTNLFRSLDPQRPCALATYSRSTMLRVTLLLAGFFVGAGRASGQKEETTVAANTTKLIANPLTRGWLERARRSDSAEPLHEPVYQREPLSAESWEKLRLHPQFSL